MTSFLKDSRTDSKGGREKARQGWGGGVDGGSEAWDSSECNSAVDVHQIAKLWLPTHIAQSTEDPLYVLTG